MMEFHKNLFTFILVYYTMFCNDCYDLGYDLAQKYEKKMQYLGNIRKLLDFFLAKYIFFSLNKSNCYLMVITWPTTCQICELSYDTKKHCHTTCQLYQTVILNITVIKSSLNFTTTLTWPYYFICYNGEKEIDT